jgi:BirA family biotin operon repressor/biotin-[acetyl-CoA-carboxylase] ligase
MGQTISRKAFLQSLLQELEEGYAIFLKEGGTAVLKAWRERAQIKGRKIKVTSFGETLVGIAVDVDSDGALILKTEDGSQKRIVAGDIEYKRQNAKCQSSKFK